MTDIVERLRAFGAGTLAHIAKDKGRPIADDINEAAAEIERLRKEADENQWRKDWHILADEIERLRELLLALANHLETEWLPIQHHQNEWADDYPETFALLQRVNEVAGDKP